MTNITNSIKELADKKYPDRLWGFVEEGEEILFMVDGITKKFNNIKELEEFLK